MCRPQFAAAIADPEFASSTDDDWLALWEALIALEAADFEAAAVE